MGIIPCQDASRSTFLLLLAVINSLGFTKPGEQSDVRVAATTIQDTPKLTERQSEWQEYDDFTTVPFIPLETITDTWKSQGFKKENGASIHYSTLKLPKRSTYSHVEVLMDSNIEQFSESHDHTDYGQNKYDTIFSETPGKVPATEYYRTKRNVVTRMPDVTTTRSSSLIDAPSSQISTFDIMFLCDHPPETFSSNFLGSSWEACLRYDRMRTLYITDTLEICNRIYTLTESNPQAFTTGLYHSHAGPLRVIANKNYVLGCLPLFRRFSSCEERDFLTICWKERIVFAHTYDCPRSSNDLFLAAFLLQNNTFCFHEFCEGWQRVVDSEVGGLTYRLTNTHQYFNTSSCGRMTMSLSHIYRQYNGTLYILVNNHWPCCYPLYLVIWAGRPEAHGLNGAWSYLPPACQAGEVLLLVFVGCVMVGGIGGNLLVLIVMVNGGHRGQESSLLRTSLAFADLLTASFVVVPSFVQHLTPFFSTPHYYKVTRDIQLTDSPVNVSSSIYITDALYGWSGFPLFQSILFNTTSTVSLLMIMVLSLERFVITSRYLRYRDYFSYCRTVLAITGAWITSFANALWFATSEDGFGTQWLTFEKLPTGASGNGPGGVRNYIYHGQFVIFFMLGIFTVVFSVMAIWYFVKEQLHVAAEWRSLKMKASRQYSRDNRHVLTTMTLMLTIFLTSTLPLAINITMNSIFYRFQQQTLFSYLSWWLFIAGSAWNPWVYNVRSNQFKEDIRNIQHQIKRAFQRHQPRGDSLSSPASFPSES